MKKQAELRKDLVARLVELGHRVDEFEDEMRAPLEADFAEQATQMEGAEVAEAEQIKAAIGRIDAGSYGDCANCGNPINPERLEALPYATTCMVCASR